MERVTDWHNQLVTQWGIEPVKIHANLNSVALSIEQAIREGKGTTSAALSYINDLAAKTESSIRIYEARLSVKLSLKKERISTTISAHSLMHSQRQQEKNLTCSSTTAHII